MSLRALPENGTWTEQQNSLKWRVITERHLGEWDWTEVLFNISSNQKFVCCSKLVAISPVGVRRTTGGTAVEWLAWPSSIVSLCYHGHHANKIDLYAMHGFLVSRIPFTLLWGDVLSSPKLSAICIYFELVDTCDLLSSSCACNVCKERWMECGLREEILFLYLNVDNIALFAYTGVYFVSLGFISWSVFPVDSYRGIRLRCRFVWISKAPIYENSLVHQSWIFYLRQVPLSVYNMIVLL